MKQRPRIYYTESHKKCHNAQQHFAHTQIKRASAAHLKTPVSFSFLIRHSLHAWRSNPKHLQGAILEKAVQLL